MLQALGTAAGPVLHRAYCTGAAAHVVRAAAVALSTADVLHNAILQGCQPLLGDPQLDDCGSPTLTSLPPERFLGDLEQACTPQPASVLPPQQHSNIQATARQQLASLTGPHFLQQPQQCTALPRIKSQLQHQHPNQLPATQALGTDCLVGRDMDTLLASSRSFVGKHLLQPTVASVLEALQSTQSSFNSPRPAHHQQQQADAGCMGCAVAKACVGQRLLELYPGPNAQRASAYRTASCTSRPASTTASGDTASDTEQRVEWVEGSAAAQQELLQLEREAKLRPHQTVPASKAQLRAMFNAADAAAESA